MKQILFFSVYLFLTAFIFPVHADSSDPGLFGTNLHIAGYADVSYEDNEDGSKGFNSIHFNPIFHFQIQDRLFFEAEVEIEIEDDGATETKLEYSNINLFLNDNLTLIAGLFQSPVGYFRQNLHPSWVNKMATAPPGFGHDGAAPLSDMGLQLRGAHKYGGNARFNYAVYTANGPRITELAGEIHGVEAEGATGNDDESLVTGGRIAFLPTPSFEIGLSAAVGDVALPSEDTRDYDVVGADFSWQIAAFDIRGEYIEQEVGELTGSIAPEDAKWTSGYLQVAYRWLPTNWETAIRYTDFDSPHADDDQKQTAISFNYYLYANAVIKLMYAANDGQSGSSSDSDQILTQISYGF